MPDYTHEFSNFPDSLIGVKTYKDIDDDIASIVAQIEQARADGDFKRASEIISEHPELSDYNFSANDVNRIIEEVRNTQVFAKKHEKAIDYGGSYYDGEKGNLWIGEALPDLIFENEDTSGEFEETGG